VSLLGCTKGKPEPSDDAVAPGPPAAVEATRPSPPAQPRISLLAQHQQCELHHRGLILDWADPSTLSQQGFRLGAEANLGVVERSGVQLRLLDQRSTSLDFWWSKPTVQLEVTALVRARSSERVTLSIDGRALGTLKLRPDELQEIVLPLRDFALTAGRHQLTVSLPRSRKAVASLEIAWVRLGDEARLDKMDQPTSRSEALSEVTIHGERKASVILREGSGFRCPLWIAGRGRRLVGRVGLWGNGAGEGEIAAVLEDGSEKIVHRVQIEAADERAWLPVDVDLAEFAGRFVSLEWRAPRLQSGARLAFAEPTIVEPPLALADAPRARRALLIVLAGLSHEYSPPRATELGLPVLQQFAVEATHFPGYRTSTTSAQGVIASLLSGTSPWEHGLGEQDRVWPRKVRHLAETIEAGGGHTAFFTGVPTSFSAFGFDRGFEVFEQVSPVSDVSAVEPVRRARSWLGTQLLETAPVLGVVHLRGGHPPFDVNYDAALELPPAEYGGDVDPRRAAIQLLGIRSRSRPVQRQMPDEDWVRLGALRKKALLDQSTALMSLFNSLREKNAWDDSLIVIVGDASSGERPTIPFDERALLSESQLALPLFVKFPGKHLSGRPVSGLFSPRDLYGTIAEALGQSVPDGAIAIGKSDAEHDARQRAHVAYRDGHYATRLGPYLLNGLDGRVPRLCRVDLDPNCSLDRAASEPVPTRVLWLATYAALHDALRSPPAKIEVPPDEALASALTVWGITR